jgi:recombination protein RecA
MANPKARELMLEINKLLKKPAVQMASDNNLQVGYLSTGLLPFDILLPGGLPRGRMTTISGGPSSLKSYVGLCAVAEAQREGLTCAMLDTEHTFDPLWAEACGIDLGELIVQQPETGEQAFDVAELLVRNKTDLLVFDSVAAAQPQVEADQMFADNKVQPGRHASLFSKGLRKITAVNKDTAILFTNQMRTNIGVTFGSPDVEPGGKAILYYSSLRMKVTHSGKVNEPVKAYDGEKWVDTKRQVAQHFRASMEKSKLSKPFGEVNFVWSLNSGSIDIPMFLIAQGLETGIITIEGQSWVYGETSIRGKDNFKDFIASEEAARHQLEREIRTHHGLSTAHMTVETRSTNRAAVRESSLAGSKPATAPKSKVVGAKKASSPRTARGRTPAPALVRSRSTAATKKS